MSDAAPKSPYPGLRSFERTESHLFFGREQSGNEILTRLAARRFVAVLGSSGSGKSSLVRTGVLNDLEAGFMPGASGSWKVVDFHPEDSPLRSLARGLLRMRSSDEVTHSEVMALSTMLRQSPLALVDWCADGNLKPGTNLLLFADQFEELFRYDSYKSHEEAQAFVSILIESAKQHEVPIYVVLTMRSEYLGALAMLEGLAEEINAGLYLVPRLNREQCAKAIARPARVMGGRIADDLVNRILNDLAAFAPWNDRDDAETRPAAPAARATSMSGQVAHLDNLARRADQLPLMQQVLSRLWAAAQEDGRREITLTDYQEVGGLDGSFSKQAGRIEDNLVATHGEEARGAIRAIFCELVEGSSIADAVRRPREFRQLVQSLGGADKEPLARAVVEAFRADGVNFLRPSSGEALEDGTIVDISHESLIRQWPQLVLWVEDESRAASWWRGLADDARRHKDNKGDLLPGIEMRDSLEQYELRKPTPNWAARYGGHFEDTINFLMQSRDQVELLERKERERLEVERDFAASKKQRRWVLSFSAVVVLVISAIALWAWDKADTNHGKAEANQAEADRNKAESDRNKAESDRNKEEVARLGVAALRIREESERNREAANRNLAETKRVFSAALDVGLDSIVAAQAAGKWDTSAMLIGRLFDGLKFDEAGATTLPAEQAEQAKRLERVLKVQYLQLQSQRGLGQRRERSSLLGRLRGDIGRNWASDYVAQAEVNRIALVQRFRIEIFEQSTSLKDASWKLVGSHVVRSRDNSNREDQEIRGVTFFGDGLLAVAQGRYLLRGTPEDLAERKVAPQLLFPETFELSADAMLGEVEEKAPQPSSLQSLQPCDRSGGRFIALANENRLYRVELPSDPEKPATWWSLSDGTVLDHSVNPEDGRYAIIDSAGRLKVGECGRRDPAEVVVAGLNDLEQVSFLGRDLIGVASKTSSGLFPMIKVAIIQRGTLPREWVLAPDEGAKDGHGVVRDLPPGARLVAFLDRERVWIATGRVFELWSIAQKDGDAVLATGGHVVAGRDDQFLGATTKGLLFMRAGGGTRAGISGGALAVYPTARVDRQSPKRMMALIGMWRPPVAPGGDALTKVTRELLEKFEFAIRLAAEPTDEAAAPCSTADLRQMIDALEREGLSPRYPESEDTVRARAQDLAKRCKGANAGEDAALVAELANSIAGSGQWKSLAGQAVTAKAIMAAAEGRPEAMRLLAVLLDLRHGRGLSGARGAFALRKLAIADGAAVPLPIVDAERFSLLEPPDRVRDLDREIVDLVRGRTCSARGTDQEYLALSEINDQRRLNPIVHYTRAAMYYAASGDERSATIVNAYRQRLVSAASSGNLVEAWSQAIHGCRDSVAPKPPSVQPRPGSLAQAARAVTGRIADPLAKAELLWMIVDHASGDAAVAELQAFALQELGQTKPEDSAKAAQILFALTSGREDKLAAANRALSYLVAFDSTGLRPSPLDQKPLGDAMQQIAAAEAGWLAQNAAALGELRWRFLLSSEPEFRRYVVGNEGYAAFLAAAIGLQKHLAAHGVNSPRLESASGIARFWSERLANVPSAPRPAAEFLAQVRAVQQAEIADPMMLIQHAEWLQWWAERRVASEDTLDNYVQQRDALQELRKLYARIPADRLGTNFDPYILAATASGRSWALRKEARAEAFVAVKAFEAGDEAVAILASRNALGLLHQQHLMFETAEFARVKTDRRIQREGFCCLKADSDATDALVVGFLAGIRSIQRERRFAVNSPCEERVANPFDSRRRYKGVPSLGDVDLAIASCTDELAREFHERRLYLLGRLYQYQGSSRRNEALEKLLGATDGNYTIAYNNLQGLMDANGCVALRAPMLEVFRVTTLDNTLLRSPFDGQRSVPLRRNLDEVAALLADRKEPPLEPRIVDWLRSNLRLDREVGGYRLDVVARLDVDDVKHVCGWRD